jgi:5,10-methylenetetrahydromethanopterin reductase
MRVGLNLGAYAPLADVMAVWEEADASGVSWVGVSDTPLLAREAHVAAAALLSRPGRARVSPMVSNPLTRHPSVTAAALATLDELAPGRIALALGSGDSAIYRLGLTPSSVDHLRRYVVAVQQLLRGEEAEWLGARFRLLWDLGVAHDVKVFVSCHGPKTLRMAAEVADGIIVGFGVHAAAVDFVRQQIAEAAHGAGRDPDEIEVWWHVVAPRADTEEEALSYYVSSAHLIARSGAAGGTIPEELHPALEELARDQRLEMHGVPRPWRVELAKSTGVDQFLIERGGALFGPPSQVQAALRALEARGVDKVVVLPLGEDRLASALFLCREVLAPLTDVVLT